MLRKPILVFVTLVLMFLANFIVFSTARAVFTTMEGLEEASRINIEGNLISNLDPDAEPHSGDTADTGLQNVYDHLDEHFDYALYTDGETTDVANEQGVDVFLVYMNQNYHQLNGPPVSEGEDLTFAFDSELGEPIPVLVGYGLREDYPVGTTFTMYEPALDRELEVRVSGVLAANAAHSNLYALDSKQYYNFSIAIPVTEEFIDASGLAFKENALMDLIVMNTDRDSAAELAQFIEAETGVTFNFFTQEENIQFHNEYFVSSLNLVLMVSALVAVVILGLSVWTSLANVRVMLPAITINFLVGVSYTRMRRILAGFYAVVALIPLLVVFAQAAWHRCSVWRDKDSTFMTYGFLGLIRMDWLALLCVALFNVVLVVILVEIIMWRLKKIPISVGVLSA